MGTACSGTAALAWQSQMETKKDTEIGLENSEAFFFFGMKNVKPILVNILFLRLF